MSYIALYYAHSSNMTANMHFRDVKQLLHEEGDTACQILSTATSLGAI